MTTSCIAPQHSGCIRVRGAATNNLKSINVDIPYGQLIVITGLSGAGKSSLGFGTIFAEGSRRYVERFSPHARQFLEKIKRPPVDSIQGILPSIGLSRKKSGETPRARVGTTTDIYSYVKLLFARLGDTYSPISGELVKQDSIEDVVNFIIKANPGDEVVLIVPLHVVPARTWEQTLEIEQGKGFIRLMYQGNMVLIEDLLAQKAPIEGDTYLIIDRLKMGTVDKALMKRLADSVKTAFFEGKGTCRVEILHGKSKTFSDRFDADGITFETPTLHLFSFNNPYGSCKKCTGLGRHRDIAPSKVIPDPEKSLREGAVLPWENILYTKWKQQMLDKDQIPAHRSYKDLTVGQKRLIWEGDEDVQGINQFFEWVHAQSNKIQYRLLHARYQGIVTCGDCKGSGLRKEVAYVKIGNKNVIELLSMSVDELYDFLMNLTLPSYKKKVGDILCQEIQQRLYYLKKVGLGYLTLNRRTNTLSSGEYQRARLAKVLGSPLVDNLYVLDEPTSGLHKRDTAQLVASLIDLKDAGNTVIVVGHEELMMRAAGTLIDIGPKAGVEGGYLVFQGSQEEFQHAKNSYTSDYLFGKSTIPIPSKRRKFVQSIHLPKVTRNNLENVEATFPLNVFTVVSGVSGSGKSTLVQEVLYPALCTRLGMDTSGKGGYVPLEGDVKDIHNVVYMGQNGLNKSTRSNVATYLNVYDSIRKLFVTQLLAQERNYTVSSFSFNSPGGRCEECMGEGRIKIDMQFMENVIILCDVCNGNRFQEEVLEIKLRGKSIIDVLNMTVKESLNFFKDYREITDKLSPLSKIGLNFMRLGQPSSTFSAGEAQRIKLAVYLANDRVFAPTFFIFDEPTTGLHFHDYKRLLQIFNELIDRGHTLLVIEHNMDIIKSADWVIDLGPEGGTKGGHIVFAGTPEDMLKQKNSYTARFLREKMQQG